MRSILVAAVAFVVGVSGALAGPLAPGVVQDGLEFGGTFQNPMSLLAGDTITMEGLTPNTDQARYMMGADVLASAGAYELAGVEVAGLAPFDLVIATGAGNNGISLNLNYDRSRVVNRGFLMGADDQTGILNATITSTLAADVFQVFTGLFTQTVLFMGGELVFDDGAGVYNANMPGSRNLIGVFASDNDLVSLSFGVSTVDFQFPTASPERALLR